MDALIKSAHDESFLLLKPAKVEGNGH